MNQVQIKPKGNLRGNYKLTWKVRFYFIEISVFSTIILALLVSTYLRNEIWRDEVALWKDCMKKSPRKARVYSNLGFAYFQESNYGKALEMSQRAIEIDPKFARAYHNIGLVYQKTGDLDEAATMIRKSLEIDPALHIAHYSLGGVYFESRRYKEAVDAFNRFLKIFPRFPDVHHLVAIAYGAQKQFDRAIEEFEWELRINPYHTLAHLNLGQIYWYEFQDKKRALYHLKAALSLDPFLPNRKEIQRLVRVLEGLQQ